MSRYKMSQVGHQTLVAVLKASTGFDDVVAEAIIASTKFSNEQLLIIDADFNRRLPSNLTPEQALQQRVATLNRIDRIAKDKVWAEGLKANFTPPTQDEETPDPQ